MNKITLIGNLVRDPELRSTASGKSVCSFTIAVNKRFAKENETAQFFRINAWGKLGENCAKYLAKGRKVAAVGELEGRLFESKDGRQMISLDVTADEIEFLSPRADGEIPAETLTTANLPLTNEDIPF